LPENLIQDLSDSKKIIQIITPENKDFMFKKAIPEILKRAEDLHINEIEGFTAMPRIITNPEKLNNIDNLVIFK